MSQAVVVNGHQLPDLLLRLLRAGLWQTPDESTARSAIPFLEGPLWLYDLAAIVKLQPSPPGLVDPELASLVAAEEQERANSLAQVRSSQLGQPVELPWLDLDGAVFIASTTDHGTDQWLALDYRINPIDPRVVGNAWSKRGCEWREVAPTLQDFAAALELPTQID